MGHALMENRHGRVVDGLASRATGSAECLAGEIMLMRREDGERTVDGRRRQGLRHGGLRRHLRGLPGHAACGPQHFGTTFEHHGRGGGERALSGEPDPS